jgi:MYXO-CTERM domain-containing protein
VGDDNGARTLRIGNWSSGFIENLSGSDQVISIATLQFQSNSTISTTGTGTLSLSSNLTGTNRNLTFDTAADISVTGNITTGTGTLTKQGSGNLTLAGANTYTGLTTVSAGAIVLAASNVFADTGRISIASGASLQLNNLADTISRLSGAGTVDFGSAGTGQLRLDSGTSTFAGSFVGSGELIIGAGATLTLGANFTNTNLKITLDGGTLNLAGYSLTAGALSITGNSTVDFSSGGGSVLAVDSLGFASGSLQLSAQNWADASDYFFSQTGYAQGSAPLNQVEFQGWSTADTKWQAYDSQITPVPEPATYGAWLLAGLGAVGLWRRHRRRRA